MPPIWILSLVMKTGLTGRLAKGMTWAVIALVAIGIAIAGVHYVKSRIEQGHTEAVTLDRAAINAEVTNRVIEADRSANANATMAEAIARENEKEIDDAITNSSDRTVAVLERMREQQNAGRR